MISLRSLTGLGWHIDGTSRPAPVPPRHERAPLRLRRRHAHPAHHRRAHPRRHGRCTATVQPAVPADLGHDTLSDANISKCRVDTPPGTSDMWQSQVNVRITNSVDTTRTYDVAVEVVRGDERITTVYGFAENLRPGQKATAKGVDFLDAKPAGQVECRLLSVTAH